MSDMRTPWRYNRPTQTIVDADNETVCEMGAMDVLGVWVPFQHNTERADDIVRAMNSAADVAALVEVAKTAGQRLSNLLLAIQDDMGMYVNGNAINFVERQDDVVAIRDSLLSALAKFEELDRS